MGGPGWDGHAGEKSYRNTSSCGGNGRQGYRLVVSSRTVDGSKNPAKNSKAYLFVVGRKYITM